MYDHLEDAILGWARAEADCPDRDRYVVDDAEGLRLTGSTVRRILDPNAVEVARMSLALRYLERVAGDLADEPKNILAGIGRNIRHGNALVGPDIASLGLDPGVVRDTMPFGWTDRLFGFGNVYDDGGFDAVVGNPPYIEVKRYKEWMPAMYRYLKDHDRYATTDQGKTDIAMPFMEQSARQLREGGRLGFIIQNRFFKTEYGQSTRRWLRKGKWLQDVEDFRDLQVFPGRTTYTAILVLEAGSSQIRYRTYSDVASAEANMPSLDTTLDASSLDDGPWSLDQPDLLAVHTRLAKRHKTIGEHPELEISVGLQTLYGKLYQLQASEVTSRMVRAVNGLGAEVSLERKAVRPLCRNRGFYPFRSDNADAWVIFPYDVKDGEAREILWPEFQQRFPRTAAYLQDNRSTLKKAVEVPEGRDRWHLYTRPQNLVVQAQPKVLFPMTIEDTVASVDAHGDVYQDNVNVNSLSIRDQSVPLEAVAAVLNSTIFSALARLKAGLNDAGWRKFNRQFAALVPFPLQALRTSPLTARLSGLAAAISQQQDELRHVQGEGERQAVRAALSSMWGQLDEVVEQLYGLDEEQRAVIARYPRRQSRVELPLRSAPTEGDQDQEADEHPQAEVKPTRKPRRAR